jgi:glycine/D-amino acid oxidase-like deaminating enzyme
MIKTIVIGAGVMGASVAYRLAQAGAAVTVLEAARIGGGTSGTSFAWTNAHKKPSKPYHDLNVAGMKAHAALADEFVATPWWHGGGSLEWEAEPDRAAQRENIEQLRSWGYAAEWLTLRQVRELEPDIDPATIGDAPVAFFPQEGWLDPVVYAHAMLSAARLRHGAKVVCGARVVDLITAGGDWRPPRRRYRIRGRHSRELCRSLDKRDNPGCRSAPAARTDRGLPGVYTPCCRQLKLCGPHHRN